jgi:hypothetical protein
MIVSFGTRKKRRLNWVMDALNFEYPDYERLDEGAGGAKKKRLVSILKRQAMRSIEEDQKAASKKQKNSVESTVLAPKKRKSSIWPLPRQRYKIYQRRFLAPLYPPLSALQKF